MLLGLGVVPFVSLVGFDKITLSLKKKGEVQLHNHISSIESVSICFGSSAKCPREPAEGAVLGSHYSTSWSCLGYK